MDSKEWFAVFLGGLMGALVMAMIWAISASVATQSKISNGYLTYDNKVYSVTLFDSLDIPKKEN